MIARKHALLAAAAVFALASLSSCATDLQGTDIYACPNQVVFEESVSPYMERRCGTLDCHGGVARPMRLYGVLGLRHPDESNVSGLNATTQAELDANYAVVCNLEPEKMNESVANLGNSAEDLIIIRKARGVEKHKGGKVVNETDHADLCLLGWLRGDKAATVAADCQAAVDQLKPE